MASSTEPGADKAAGAPKSFIALRHPAARMYLIGAALAMMADNIEHVISYWMLFQKFHSPALGGFAQISHWAPFLFFSFWAGGLADRYDPRRLIQIGMVLFMLVSVAWGVLFWLDIMEMWHAVILLTIHGFAGVLWGPAAQIFIHAIVGKEQLQSAVRTMSSSRMLGILFGPAVGGGMLLAFGPAIGILCNVLFYIPLAAWLFWAPAPLPKEKAPPRRGVSSFDEVVRTIRDIAGNKVVMSMTLLAGVSSFIVGGAYQAQMPEFATNLLGNGDAGVLYSLLLAGNAAGALTAGIVLESRGLLPATPRTAFILVALWCLAIGGFALSSNYWVAFTLLFVAGFLNLAFNSMTRTLAQLHAPDEIRGRAIGLYNVSDLGLRTFSGVTVGFGGALVGIHYSLALSALLLLIVVVPIFIFMARAGNFKSAD
jgi:MFS family permease